MPISIPSSTLEKFTTFGDLLRFLRRRVGITQLELATAVGYSDTQISRLEQNQRPPDIPTIEARFLSVLDIENEPKVIERLLDLAANVRREDSPGLGLSPYKGLNYFDEADADLFVGREELTSKLMERVLSMTSTGHSNQTRFLAVVGASGSGKSSLVRAGLIPALRWNERSADWHFHTITPTAHPLESLATNLTLDAKSVTSTATLIDDLAKDERALNLFARRKFQSEGNSRLLLIVDQFEETFALCRSEEERNSFIGNLLRAASEADGPVIVLVTLRADFYAHCAKYFQLREAFAKNQEYIGAMNSKELRRAIEEPAGRGHWEIEPGLVDILLRDVGQEPGALPLLSHALMETWQRRRGRTMTLGGYASSGGVHGAIAETAETVFSDQFSREQKSIARRIFLRLTELGDDTSAVDTRRRANLEELILNPQEADLTRAVLKALADARLISLDENTAEVAHEALIREWPALQGWLEEDRERLRLQRQLTEAARDWLDMERTPDLLYRGIRLEQARELESIHQDELNVLEREFLTASIEAVERETAEKEAQRQRELEGAQKLAQSEKQRAEEQAHSAMQLDQRARYLTVAFIIAVIMALTAIFFSSQARKTAATAQNDKRLATARELAAASLNNLSVDPERSILLALQSVSTTRDVNGIVLPESIEALHRSIVASPIRFTLRGHNDWVVSTVFSPDGKLLASIEKDGTTILWDTESGKELHRLTGNTPPNDAFGTQRLAFNWDGTRLAIADSNLIKIWDIATGDFISTFSGHEADVWAIAFSPDGLYLASGAFDGTARIWDIATGDAIALKGHTLAIEGLAFHPNGEWLATASDDQTIKVWDTTTGKLLHNLTGFPDVVDSVAFSPNGMQLAATITSSELRIWDVTKIDGNEVLKIEDSVSAVTFSQDGSQIAAAVGSNIKIWDPSTGEELITLIGHAGWVLDVNFDPDGKKLASSSFDKTTKVWSLTPGQEVITVSGQGLGFAHVAYSPDGTKFATDGADGSATIWNAMTGKSTISLMAHDGRVFGIAFSPDGRFLATAGLDGNVMVWDSVTGKKLYTLAAHKDGVRDVAFSMSGGLLATGGFDDTARVWDAKSGKNILELPGHNGFVLGVSFSPDNTKLATSSTDTNARIWDLKSGDLLFTLTGHSDPLPDIAYSRDGTKLVTGSQDGTAIIWDATTGLKLFTLTGHTSEIQSVAFSPDGKLVATGSGDNTAKLWNVETGDEVLNLPGSLGGVTGVAFSTSDGEAHLAVASVDGVVRVFILSTDELLSLAQSRVTRTLSEEECKRYLHVDICPDQP